jgi:undecaprenyl-phosphate 4-deoxy-4-formamido-L-arabinose transferase
LLQVTQRIGSIGAPTRGARAEQLHVAASASVADAWLNFSVLPLRVATIAGFVVGAAGLAGLAAVFWLWWHERGPNYGFGLLMSALLIFSGTQLAVLGLIGEYIGRMFLAVNQRPQSVVREVIRSVQSEVVGRTS